jgi:predicted Fe-Mo cluster-binding NifX family protein
MRVALPINGERISPVLDVARRFLLVDVAPDSEVGRREARIEHQDLVAKAKRIVELGPHVLICGAISRPLETLLVSAGVRVIPNTCGAVDEVVAAFVSGRLTEQAFLMPGCTGRHRRFRRRHRGGR